MTKITIINPNIERAGRGITMPSNPEAKIEIHGGSFKDITHEAIEIRDAPGQLEQLGFDRNIPPGAVLELLKAIREGQVPADPSVVAEEIKQRKLVDRVGVAANLTAIAQAVIAKANSLDYSEFARQLSQG